MENEIDGIKIGEFIRTELGDIKKITEGFEFIIKRHNESANKIVKHSFDLIDIIEEGDYVNGKKVYSIGTICSTIGMLRTINFTDGTFITDNMQIVDVVTKELFESVSYKVEE